MKTHYEIVNIDVFGESHADEIGVKISGIRKGEIVDKEKIQKFVDRRKSGNNAWSTPRLEKDEVVILSGVENGVATGETILAVIKNNNIKKHDYENVEKCPRPSHADFVSFEKDKTFATGGGRFSGRMTAPVCIAGGLAKEILKKDGVEIGAYISRIGNVVGKNYKMTEIGFDEIVLAHKSPFSALSNQNEMVQLIAETSQKGDSVGGEIDCIVYGLPVGIGDALYDGLEGKLSTGLFAIPAVKGVEFGSGFDFATMFGSQANDAFQFENGKVVTKTNHNGGINGGISNGMPLTMRVAIKPTPSISIEQDTVNLDTKENVKIKIKGRHDSSIVPRAVPVVESVVAVALLDEMMKSKIIKE